MRGSRRAPFLVTTLMAVLVAFTTPAPPWACDTQTDFLPALNAYVKLTDTTHLLLLVLKYYY